jgi:ATP-dependent helicase/nuclease subunit B
MTAGPLSRVFTIPASAPFLPTLIAALTEGRLVDGFKSGGDPLALAAATLYLPTRRACRLARDAFLDGLHADAALLPRIVAIGDIDEDEIAFAEAAIGEDSLALPPALTGLERRMLLARLVLKWAEQLKPAARGEPPLVVGSPASALALADDLARLMDDMATREVAWERLDGLVPDHVDVYWQLTLDFLKIARDVWPNILAERQAIEPARRRDLLINSESVRLAAATHGPVIAAGSTGSMPATAKLLATIAGLPHGAVVLPGLDTDLDDESWNLIATPDGHAAPGHPQFAMHGLLTRIGIARQDVVPLAAPAPHGREALISEAMRPASATEHWHTRLTDPGFGRRISAALSGLAVIEAAHAEDESIAIAVALREAVETPDKTAALVTPDRSLARRVVAALGRWSVDVDDSGGDRLADTAAGVFARIAADCALGGLQPIDLLALLKHPWLRLGALTGAHGRAVAALEMALLRGTRPRAGSEGLRHALATFRAELTKQRKGERSDIHPAEPRANIDDADLDAATDLVRRLADALAPLEGIARNGTQAFSVLAGLHRDVVERLGTDDSGITAVFSSPDGSALATALDDIAVQAEGDMAIASGDYAELFSTAVADRVVRRPGAPGARVRIYGPLEARLIAVDRIILGGLTEGVWPPDTATDPWLSRPMRHQLGLDLPERRIGLSAHDVAQLVGAHEVILTRAAKIAGAPAVASRFLQRLAAVAGPARWAEAVNRGAHYLELARGLDRPARIARVAQPAPRPPRAARPTALSVTEIEHWLRDPYTIYAKHILKLARLDPVDMPLGAADRGSAIHAAVGEFAQAFASALPADPYAELVRIGRVHFAPLDDFPEARAFWWPRYERIARWLAGWESERRTSIADLRAEIRGEIPINLGDRSLRLSARADRIERRTDGSYVLLDFKTGSPPSDKQVRIGIAPQLTLEAAILRAGGFRDFAPGASIAEIVYVTLKGGEQAGIPHAVDLKEETPDAAADHALAKLTELARKFEDENTPYRSLVLSMWKNRYGTYDDLARVKEWSQTGGEDGGEE